MLQPKAVILADDNGIRVDDQDLLQTNVARFLRQGVEERADLILAPEYCCPWESIAQAIEGGILPAIGRLWALGCQSLSRNQFEAIETRLSPIATIIVEHAAFDEPGDFIDPLLYLFRSARTDGTPVLVMLIQPKTHPMGGGEHFEYTHLQTGSKLYRFTGPGVRPNRLVGLVCSDVLHPEFLGLVHTFHYETLLLHVQLNPDSSPPTYRAYRNSCCTIAPRTAEILTLNWALGTELGSATGAKPFIDEPRTMLLRSVQELDTSDETILSNHSKGVYLTNWNLFKTAAFIFSPDAHLHLFETTKPSVAGPPANAIRTGPRGLKLFDWHSGSETWEQREEPADDRFHSYWLTNYAELQPLLQPIALDPGKVERLVSLSIGKALSQDWYEWRRMKAFELAEDETPCRLTVCWSKVGSGHEFRAESLARFRGFAGVANSPTNFSNRLSEFRTTPFKVTYSAATAAKRFQNLHIEGGVSATAIYLGQTPSIEVVQRVMTETIRWLKFFGADSEKIAVWSLEADGLKDHMDDLIPSITGDPGLDLADIASGAG